MMMEKTNNIKMKPANPLIKGLSIITAKIIEIKDIRKSRKLNENNTAKKRLISKAILTPNAPTSILNIYTPIYLKKLGQVGHFLINLSGSISSPVIYNTPFTGAGFCQGVFSSPSINWSAFRQAPFQKAHFKGGLFGKELFCDEKVSYREEKSGYRNLYKEISKFIKETSTTLIFLYKGGN